jgi:hypothetical protein
MACTDSYKERRLVTKTMDSVMNPVKSTRECCWYKANGIFSDIL